MSRSSSFHNNNNNNNYHLAYRCHHCCSLITFIAIIVNLFGKSQLTGSTKGSAKLYLEASSVSGLDLNLAAEGLPNSILWNKQQQKQPRKQQSHQLILSTKLIQVISGHKRNKIGSPKQNGSRETGNESSR